MRASWYRKTPLLRQPVLELCVTVEGSCSKTEIRVNTFSISVPVTSFCKSIFSPIDSKDWPGHISYINRAHPINHSTVQGGLVGICVPSISTSNFMYNVKVMLNLYTLRPYSSFASLCSSIALYGWSYYRTELEPERDSSLWTSIKNKISLSLRKQAELSLFLLNLRLICSEWMKTKCTKAFWIRIYHEPLKK